MRKTAFVWIAFGFVLVTLAVVTTDSRADEVDSSDDGWRRTNQGWERAEGLSAPGLVPVQSRFVLSEEQRPSAPRWDIHPGLLVAGEVLVVMGAFLVWPQPQRIAVAHQWQRERR